MTFIGREIGMTHKASPQKADRKNSDVFMKLPYQSKAVSISLSLPLADPHPSFVGGGLTKILLENEMFINTLLNQSENQLPVIRSVDDINFNTDMQPVVEAVILVPSRFQDDARNLIPTLELETAISTLERSLIALSGGVMRGSVQYSGLFNNLIDTEALTELRVWVPNNRETFSSLENITTELFTNLRHTSGMFVYNNIPVVISFDQ